MNFEWAPHQTGMLETQNISQNSSSACNSGALSFNNYVWDTNNISVCFELFRNVSQRSYYKWNNLSFNFMFCPNYASWVYIFVNLFIFLTILWSWGIAISISCPFLSPGFFTPMAGLLCLIFVVVLISTSQRISVPVWVTVCGNGTCSTCSYQFLVTSIS